MSPHAESDEVARVRARLAEITRAKNLESPKTESAVSACKMPSMRGGCGDKVARQPVPSAAGAIPTPGYGAAPAVGCLGANRALVAWRVEDKPTVPPGRKGATVDIVWGVDGPEGAVDGKTAVPRSVARRFGPAPLSFADLGHLLAHLAALSEQTAFERIESALRSRERSTAELTRKLVDEGFSPEQVRTAIERATRCGLVDDVRFAEAFVASKMRTGWGRARIERELSRCSVDPRQLLEGWPEAYSNRDEECERARNLLAKKPVPAKNPVDKLARFLITKGYDTACALTLARERVAQDTPSQVYD